MTRRSVLRDHRRGPATAGRSSSAVPRAPTTPRNTSRAAPTSIVIGEGELTLDELLHALPARGAHALHEVRGIVFRDGAGRVRAHPGTAARSRTSMRCRCRTAGRSTCSKYVDVWRRHHGMGSVNLITARGCPYKCTWCSHAVYGYSHRRRSPDNVVATKWRRSSSATSPSSCGTRTTCSPSATPGCQLRRRAAPARPASALRDDHPRRPPAERRPRRRRWRSWAATASGSARRAAASASWMPCSAT